MRLVFFDSLPWDYGIDTPLVKGLGGSQSAACYLSAALADRGHEVFYINATSTPHEKNGVRFLGRSHPDEERLIDSADALIVINVAIGKRIRGTGIKTPMILWTGHDADQDDVQSLADPLERVSWTKIVFASQWQRSRYMARFDINSQEVIGYAMAPPFETCELRKPWYKANRPPVLAYTSTPFRGLKELLDAFPAIRETIPGTTLRVYSDMKVYPGGEPDPYSELYLRAAGMRWVDYFGSIGQSQLANELTECDYLTYPCNFPETFCIAAVEAVAAGMLPVVRSIGALPEVLGATAMSVAGDYARSVVNVMRYCQEQPCQADSHRLAAAERFRSEFTWKRRAAEWEAMLTLL